MISERECAAVRFPARQAVWHGLLTGILILPMLSGCGQKEESFAKVQVGSTTVDVKTTERPSQLDSLDRDDYSLERKEIRIPESYVGSDELSGPVTVRSPIVSIESYDGGETSHIRVPFVTIDRRGDDIHIKAPIVNRLLRKLDIETR